MSLFGDHETKIANLLNMFTHARQTDRATAVIFFSLNVFYCKAIRKEDVQDIISLICSAKIKYHISFFIQTCGCWLKENRWGSNTSPNFLQENQKTKKPMKQRKTGNVQSVFRLSLDRHERTERKAVKPVDDWRRDAVVLRSEPESSLLHLIEPTLL